MCEVAIRVVDRTNTKDVYADSKLHKRGDIVTVHDDNWPWTAIELSHPEWRIVKFPSVPLAQAYAFLEPEQDVDVAHPSRVLRLRKFAFDLDNAALPAAFKTWLADDSRSVPTRSVSFTPAQLTSYMKTRSAIKDPNVIG